MKANDIVEIIKACRVAKVSELEYNGLKIKYLQPESIPTPDFKESQTAPSTTEPSPITKFEQEFEKSQMMFINPLAYEESLARREVNEESHG